MADDHANDPDDLPAAGAADVTVLYREDQRWVATPLDEELSEDLDALILKCMQKKPDDRFQNADAVREAVRVARM